jgi:hypothetical protein
MAEESAAHRLRNNGERMANPAALLGWEDWEVPEALTDSGPRAYSLSEGAICPSCRGKVLVDTNARFAYHADDPWASGFPGARLNTPSFPLAPSGDRKES